MNKKFLALLPWILFYCLLALLLYQIILKVSNHSPTLEVIAFTIDMTLVAYLLGASWKIGEFMGETRVSMTEMKETIRKLTVSQERMRQDLNEMRMQIASR